jgi:hypothetical protein
MNFPPELRPLSKLGKKRATVAENPPMGIYAAETSPALGRDPAAH